MSDPVTQCDPTKPRKPKKPGRALRIALVLSLMVNLLVIGVMAGGAMRMRQFAPPPPSGQPDIRALWSALPDDARRELRAQAREDGFGGDRGERPSREERRERTEALNTQILDALRNEPFDAAAFAQLMMGDRDMLRDRLDSAHAAFAGQLARLSPAERADMAERLEDRWDDHHHDDD